MILLTKKDGCILEILAKLFQEENSELLTGKRISLSCLKVNMYSLIDLKTSSFKVLTYSKYLYMEIAYKTILLPQLFLKKQKLRNGLSRKKQLMKSMMICLKIKMLLSLFKMKSELLAEHPNLQVMKSLLKFI